MQNDDELPMKERLMTIIPQEDEDEMNGWWHALLNKGGYVPRNLLGLYPRINLDKELGLKTFTEF